MGYHPCSTGTLTIGHESGLGTLSGGQFDWGGRLPKGNGGRSKVLSVRSEIVRKSVKAKESLIARHTGRARMKIGLSDPVVLRGRAIAQRIKATLGITGLSPPRVHIDGEVWHLDVGLITSWGCSRSQGLGCSPIKVVRELGSERRETVRSLSVAGVGNLRRPVLSTRGPGWTYLWCTSCPAKGMAG
ncbi:hypothetical protein BER32_000040 [Clostridioides difficile]|nr:hypothetical protein BER32_000040 [Clostridioides difficile]